MLQDVFSKSSQSPHSHPLRSVMPAGKVKITPVGVLQTQSRSHMDIWSQRSYGLHGLALHFPEPNMLILLDLTVPALQLWRHGGRRHSASDHEGRGQTRGVELAAAEQDRGVEQAPTSHFSGSNGPRSSSCCLRPMRSFWQGPLAMTCHDVVIMA